jgi:hypothetical protein
MVPKIGVSLLKVRIPLDKSPNSNRSMYLNVKIASQNVTLARATLLTGLPNAYFPL